MKLQLTGWRPSFDQYYINMANVVASRASCARRRVGCILVDIDYQVLSTGYNGPASGITNCIDHACEGARMPSGTGLDKCIAVHAEQNALLQCPDVKSIYTAYCTTAPCIHCVKMLMNTSCVRIVYEEDYPHEESKRLWELKGQWEQVDSI